jgi:RNA polymerase sigma factor (sigma-70 family)
MDRDDAFQEVMIHLLEKLDKLDANQSNSNIKGWVGVVTRNKCISILRSRKKLDSKIGHSGKDDHLLTSASTSIFDESEIVATGIRSVKEINIEKMLAQLNERDRMLIALRFFDNRTIKEIDSITGLKNSAVYIKRIVEKLQKMENSEDFFDYFDGYEAV